MLDRKSAWLLKKLLRATETKQREAAPRLGLQKQRGLWLETMSSLGKAAWKRQVFSNDNGRQRRPDVRWWSWLTQVGSMGTNARPSFAP